MGRINVLDKHIANMIAAGEVVENPASVVKELVENAIDARSQSVTVEIQSGGVAYIRVTDDGCGMSPEDAKTAFLRHATSKISKADDLESIATLGFRGEALAAIAAVAKVRILTKHKDEEVGTLFECHFGEEILTTDAGCPQGTTITVENIFENVPARRKFLKKDSTEALSVAAVCEKFALSRSEIALTFISNNEVKIQTPGDGNLKSAVYACIGREFASMLFPVDYEYHGVRIHGFIAKPEFSRPNRNMQNFFVNNRYIRSRTMMAALEEGFRGFCPTGKFPACVLFCDIDLRLVDVNVHPAKLEIKFSDERRVFDSIYFAVKNALSQAVRFTGFTEDTDVFPTIEKKEPENVIVHEVKAEAPKEEPKKEPYKAPTTPPLYTPPVSFDTKTEVKKENGDEPKLDFLKDVYTSPAKEVKVNVQEIKPEVKPEIKITDMGDNVKEEIKPVDVQKTIPVEVLKQEEILPEKKKASPIYIGEAFNTYIVAQNAGSLYLVDKHAAHERIIYEKLKKPDHENSAQYLLEPINVVLTPKEAEAAVENKEYFEKIGFDFDEFGANTVIIRSIPTPISQADTKDVFTFLAGKLAEGNSKSAGEIFDRALFTAACRAAIKAGDRHTDFDNKYILDEIFNNEAVLYCPHGRPVIYEFTKQKLDKMFDRL